MSDMRNDVRVTSRLLLRAALSLLLAVALSVPGRTQGQPRFERSAFEHAATTTGSALSAGTVIDLDLPPPIELNHALQEANVQVQFDAGSPYVFGDLFFNTRVKFGVFPLTLVAGTWVEGTAICTDCSISLSGQQPTGLYTVRITPAAGVRRLRLRITELTPVAVTDNRLTGTNRDNVRSRLQNALRLMLSYRFNYRIDWRNGNGLAVMAMNLHAAPLNNSNKVYQLAWSPQLDTRPSPHVPNYQVQVLRLYNQENLDALRPDDPDRETLRNGTAVRTALDWSQALIIETESAEPGIRFTIAEGSGFYAWRVRPVGTFHEGGTADARNYGPWSSPDATNRLTFKQGAAIANVSFFWHNDPDEGISHIYSRTFTEGNRVSEKITYASPLQQVRQTQAHLPSQGTTAIAQTIYDYSNRPAITTLPTPVAAPNGLPGYQPNLVQPATANEGGRPYNAENFDRNDNPNNTAPVRQNDTPFRYYGGVQDNVPDAEGYPFSRSRYYNDGTNRVQEQSGVGRTHSIRQLATGEQARTVRTEYGTAASDELIRLFGEEAPAAASVLKTSTVDQNGVETLTYTSKEGKVIATCLVNAGTSSQSDPLLTVGEGTPAAVTITDRITENVREGGMLIAARRLVLNGASTTVAFRYDPTPCPAATEQNCLSESIKCTYDIEVLIRRVDGLAFEADIPQLNNHWVFMTGSENTVLVARKQLACGSSGTFDGALGQIALPGGTYVVEKHLVAKDAAVVTELAAQKVRDQIEPLTNLIMGWLDQAKCDQDIAAFHANLRGLATDMLAIRNNTKTPAEINSKYAPTLPAGFLTRQHYVEVVPATGVPQAVYISSACCTNLKIPVQYAPVFSPKQVSMKPGQVKWSVNPFLFVKPTGDTGPGIFSQHTDFFPDFEGYAYSFFWDCVPADADLDNGINAALIKLAAMTGKTTAALQSEFNDAYLFKGNTSIYAALGVSEAVAVNKLKFIHYKILAPYVLGWDRPGTFNLMVQHMLKDQYKTTGFDKDGKVLTDPTAVQQEECGPSETSFCDADGNCRQYRLDDLFRCWVVQLNYLRTNLRVEAGLECPDWEVEKLEPSKDPATVSDGVDDENNDDQTVHDSHIDDHVKSSPWITRWLVKKKIKKISKRVRKVQKPDMSDPDNEGGDVDASEHAGAVRLDYHAVEEFLNCTGYRFAKILTELPNESAPLPGDAEGTYTVPSAVNAAWAAYNGVDRKYKPNAGWRVSLPTSPTTQKRIFAFTKDPVYAFKYFEYVTADYFVKTPAGTPPPDQTYGYPEVEFNSCFTDPNVCRNAAGQPVPCNGATTAAPGQHPSTGEYRVTNVDHLSNFCGYGKIKCDVSHLAWTGGQRYSFYTMLNNFRKQPDETPEEPLRAVDYSAPGYVVAAGNNVNNFLDWQSGADRTSIYGSTPLNFTVNGTRLPAKVEIDISALNTSLAQACVGKKDEYAKKLSDYLEERCYKIGGCKTATNDNVIPLEDFNMLVDLLIAECKHRGQVNTFRTNSELCRDIKTPRNVIFAVGATNPNYKESAVVEYGVATAQDAQTLGCAQAVLKYRDGLTAATFTTTSTALTATPAVNDQRLALYDCTGKAVDFKQWLHRREALEMTIRISLPSKCIASQPGTLPDCEPVVAGGSEYANPNLQNNSLPTTQAPPADPKVKPAATYRSQGVRLNVQVTGSNAPVVTPSGRGQ